ncbi:hypothetical protein [Rickettsiella endosymbiont of Dermanyssus gallinae]|uniref:hypothetical protein n=1 Tax=Rickettsiella endosymbiont of Dermanyssus gallinae TaxID=2856608 RepID=UPI001C52BA53|nr:hypothetical protein [Rickettsiella endosymbiont of Dermanyssus gallinae]
MNIRTLLIILLLILPSLASAHLIGGIRRALPPEYLRVPQWQQCAGSITCGSAQFVCLPKLKPSFCPYLSWRRLKSKHRISDCSEGCQGLGFARTAKPKPCK